MPKRNAGLVCLYDDELLEISHIPGTSGMAVVSFAGIGLKVGPIKIHEFSKSLDGTPHDIFFIRDKARRWYTGLTDKITDLVNRHLDERGIETTACLGHSMGAFGAMYLAPSFRNCKRVIAFSPQSTLSREHAPWEQRWQKFRRNIPAGQELDATLQLDPRISYWIVVGLDNPDDLRHVQRYVDRNVQSIRVIGVNDAEHSAALRMKKQKALVPFLEALLEFRDDAALEVLKDVSHEILNADELSLRIANAPQTVVTESDDL